MPEANLNARDEMLVQWLREAHSKESELEAALEQHIDLTEKMAYKKRLRSHLTETRDHRRSVAQRISQIGGQLDDAPLPTAITDAAGKTFAAIKSQFGVLQAALSDSEQSETHLRNAQDELREEHVEIALYSLIEAFALEVGDADTAKLAASICRDEVRMAKYLEAELPRLVRDLVRAEVPIELRRKGRAAAGRSRAASTRTTATARTTARGKSRASAGRRTGSTSRPKATAAR